MNGPVSLTISIPTYRRPDLLRRALSSVTAAPPWVAERTEIVVTDNSEDTTSKAVFDLTVEHWSGAASYVQNPPGTGMVGNFNRAVEAAGGRYVLVLHDDDYLLPGGLERLHRGIARVGDGCAPLVYGVRVVDQSGRKLRHQRAPLDERVAASEMLMRFLRHSSLVRFPAMVVPRATYAAAGPFDDSVGGLTDIDMWSRLFARFGAIRVAATTAAYVVHPDAATVRTWTPEAVAAVVEIFKRRAADGVLERTQLEACRRAWLHQFILAGAVRRLRAGDRAGAGTVMALFDLPELETLGWSARWAPIRAVLAALTAGAGATEAAAG